MLFTLPTYLTIVWYEWQMLFNDGSDQAGGSAAVFGGVVKGAGTFFSNIKDMSSKVVQSVAG